MFYRVKQFFLSVASSYKPIDEEYLKKYLKKEELNLFFKLNTPDKHHSIRVSKEALNIINNEFKDEGLKNSDKFKYELAKAGLLHDIGKSEIPLNPMNKAIAVLINKTTKGAFKGSNKFKILDSYYNHPKKGLNILINSKLNYSKELLEVVQCHHKDESYVKKSDNNLLKIIKLADDRN